MTSTLTPRDHWAIQTMERQRAKASPGLRVAVIGKGGAGKTVLVGTMARLLARQGRQVLAVDLDTSPGLAFSLGVPLGEAGLPAEAVEADPGANYGWVFGVPEDPQIEKADQLGVAPSDHDPQSPAMVAIASLAAALVPVAEAEKRAAVASDGLVPGASS